MFNGKIHYFDWAMFNCYVSSPEGIPSGKLTPENHPLLEVSLIFQPDDCQGRTVNLLEGNEEYIYI